MNKIKTIEEINNEMDIVVKSLSEIVDFEHPVTLQQFKTYYSYDVSIKWLNLHKLTILKSIVYSKACKLMNSDSGQEITVMNGFVELNDRLPDEKDNIIIIKGKYYFDTLIYPGYVYSEIGFINIRQ